MKVINTYRTIVIGTGCAGYSAADCLCDKGITDIVILSDNRVAGTSRNAGSTSTSSTASTAMISTSIAAG